jgi:hypothetical protein
MKALLLKRAAAIGSLIVAGTLVAPQPAPADTASTAAIIAGAMGIVGALLIDANNRPYYVKNNRRYYVSQPEAQYYRSHHHVVQRQAYVPEQEYPIARNPYQGGNNGRH